MTAGWLRNRPLRLLKLWVRRARLAGRSARGVRRGPVTLVVILDGTMSSLEEGRETNVGLIWKLLSRKAPSASLAMYYEPGIQFTNWSQLRDVIEGRGLNRQIRRAYGWLSSHYRPGDRIFLFGYSRGAYAVRSLAGVIDRVGLLTPASATERNVFQAYRHYRTIPDSEAARRFRAIHCHPDVFIDMVGVFDTVKALGLRAPLVWMLERAEASGLRLPDGWRDAYPCDPLAPSIGLDRGWGRALRSRRPRQVGLDRSERIDDTALEGPEPAPFVDPFGAAMRRAEKI